MAFRDIRKSRKWLSAEEIRILIALLIVLAALFALNIYLARTLPGGEWVNLRWSGVRAFLGETTDTTPGDRYGRTMPGGKPVLYEKPVEPYGTEVAQSVQQIVYGRVAFASEYRYILNDPFYIVLLYTPLVIVPGVVNWLIPFANVGFELVRGIWMLLSEVALFFTVLLSFRLAEWQPPRWLFVGLMGLGLFGFFSLNALVTASPAIFMIFIIVCILLALRSFSDEPAGALLLLVAYQWEITGLFFLFILIFVIANRRWGVLAGFGMSLVILLIVSFLAYPGWGLAYIRAALSNFFQGYQINLGTILTEWFPTIRFSLGGVMSVIAIGVVIIESIGAIRTPFRRVMWTACLALAAMPLTGLAIFPSNFVVLIPTLVLVVALIWERWRRGRFLIVLLILTVVLIAPYALYYETVLVYAPLYTQLLSVLPPVAAIVGLYWMRWWVVHSPRTWADQIGFRK
jgi:hypothetical protein